MCNRFSRTVSVKNVALRFDCDPPDWNPGPDFNIAPTDPAVVVMTSDKKREMRQMRFGLIPRWAKDRSFGTRCMNARAETVDTLPSFRDAFKKRRCLVVTDGFFEWKKEGKVKIPFRFVMKDRELFALAGIWDRWTDRDETVVESFAIVTTESSGDLREFHDRMPVILNPETEAVWLDEKSEPALLKELLKPFPPDLVDRYPVSRAVNSSRTKTFECVEPLRPEGSSPSR